MIIKYNDLKTCVYDRYRECIEDLLIFLLEYSKCISRLETFFLR
jgi:hypothetical protein